MPFAKMFSFPGLGEILFLLPIKDPAEYLSIHCKFGDKSLILHQYLNPAEPVSLDCVDEVFAEKFLTRLTQMPPENLGLTKSNGIKELVSDTFYHH